MAMFDQNAWCLNCEAITENVTRMETQNLLVFYCAVCNDLKGKKFITRNTLQN